jgi:hypothetical protein
MAKDHVSIFDARLYTRHDAPKQFSDAVHFYFIGGSIVTLFSLRQFRSIWKDSHRKAR